MVDLSTIKGLQTTFQEIGRRDVGVQQTENEGAAFGRKVKNKGQAWPGQGITATNSAILGTVLGQLKGAGANPRLLQFAEQTFHELNYQKPITGRNAAQAMDKIAQFAESLAKNTEEAMANFDAKGEKTFNKNFRDVLTQVGQNQGHGEMTMNEETKQRLLGDFKDVCTKQIHNTGLPIGKEQLKSILTNLAQREINTDTHKTLCDACTTLRTPIDGGKSPSEIAFQQQASVRGMNVPLDAKARNTLNAIWKAESKQTFMGEKPHKPSDDEIKSLLDDVINQYLDLVAAANAAKNKEPAIDQSPFSVPSHPQLLGVPDKDDETEPANAPFPKHQIVTPTNVEKEGDAPDVTGDKPVKQSGSKKTETKPNENVD